MNVKAPSVRLSLDYHVAHTSILLCALPPIEYGGFGSVGGKIETDIKINHEGEVNRYIPIIVACRGIHAPIQHIPAIHT